MRYLFKNWNNFKRSIENRPIMLFLDYDGTLTPIVENPDKAFMPTRTKELLGRLAKNPRCKLAIISGRALKDIKNTVGLKNIIYSGNHGLEIEGPKIKFTTPISEKYKVIFKQIKDGLNKRLSSVKGVILEDKGFSLSFHYRLVKKKDAPLVKSIFHETTAGHLIKDEIKVKSGKMVFEVSPPVEWDKGKVVLWLLARQKFILEKNSILPIYIGDDVTDEDAFRALKNDGLTIFVGKPKVSHAKYYLKDTREVTRFLKCLLKL